MAFRASAGRILVTDAADAIIVFDSSERMFNATDRVTGSVVVPQRQATFINGNFNDVDVDTNHAIASVNPAADTVVGAFKISTSTPQGLAGLGWYNASGTYMHYIDSVSPVTSGSSDNHSLSCLAGFTFVASGGQLVLHERCILSSQGNIVGNDTSITLLAITFDYNLYVGSFV